MKTRLSVLNHIMHIKKILRQTKVRNDKPESVSE